MRIIQDFDRIEVNVNIPEEQNAVRSITLSDAFNSDFGDSFTIQGNIKEIANRLHDIAHWLDNLDTKAG